MCCRCGRGYSRRDGAWRNGSPQGEFRSSRLDCLTPEKKQRIEPAILPLRRATAVRLTLRAGFSFLHAWAPEAEGIPGEVCHVSSAFVVFLHYCLADPMELKSRANLSISVLGELCLPLWLVRLWRYLVPRAVRCDYRLRWPRCSRSGSDRISG